MERFTSDEKKVYILTFKTHFPSIFVFGCVMGFRGFDHIKCSKHIRMQFRAFLVKVINKWPTFTAKTL